jgi:ribosomal RNA-processing protein 8
VADLGCGDAKVAAAAQQAVRSFDLTETAPGVVACNMADVPLPDGSVDAAIFCLSLMGTDYGAFLGEAARILKPAGWLWIAEVQSRFVDDAGSSVLPDFLEALGALGFVSKRKDTSNSHFLVLELQREQQARGGGNAAPKWPHLRACQYKKR